MTAFDLTCKATATSLVAALALAIAAGPALATPRKPAADAVTKTQPASPAPAHVFTINQLLAKQETGRPAVAGQVAAASPRGTLGDGEAASDAAPSLRRSTGPEPFGMYAFKAPEGELWTKWRGMEADLAGEAKKIETCRTAGNCAAEAKQYLAIVAELKARTGRARLETVNRLMNGAIRYVSDQQRHGVPDRWTAPLASLAAGLGDCEDFAIAKYVALRDAGVAESDMRLVLVRDTSIRIDHAVLTVRQDGEWLVLDNRRAFVAEPGELKHYMPLFALDHEGVKLFAAPYASWGTGGDFAGWTLRGSDRETIVARDPDVALDFGSWSLRGTSAEPAADGG